MLAQGEAKCRPGYGPWFRTVALIPKGSQLLAGGKRSATTGKLAKSTADPGGIAALRRT